MRTQPIIDTHQPDQCRQSKDTSNTNTDQSSPPKQNEPSMATVAAASDWQIPDIRMMLNGRQVSLHETLHMKRGILIGVPGAFTRVCTQRHIPGFRDCMKILRKAVQFVACVGVNDPYVLRAWAKELKCPPDMVMISDWAAKFTKALGLELNASKYHMGTRCRRFCVLVENSTIIWFGLEQDAFVDSLGLILRHLGYINDKDLEEIVNIWSKTCEEEPGQTKCHDNGCIMQQRGTNELDAELDNSHHGNLGVNIEQNGEVLDLADDDTSLNSIGVDLDQQGNEHAGETITTETDTVEDFQNDEDDDDEERAVVRPYLDDIIIKPVNVMM